MKVTIRKQWGKHKPGTELEVTKDLAERLKKEGYLTEEKKQQKITEEEE